MFKKINPFLKNNKSFSENTKVIDFLCKSYIIMLNKKRSYSKAAYNQFWSTKTKNAPSAKHVQYNN